MYGYTLRSLLASDMKFSHDNFLVVMLHSELKVTENCTYIMIKYSMIKCFALYGLVDDSVHSF